LESLGMRFRRTPGYPDYHPGIAGASVAGRGIESAVFDVGRLGEWSDRFQKRAFPRTMPMGTRDVVHLVLARRTLTGFLTYARVLAHFLIGKATGRSLAGGGRALAAQLLHQALQRGAQVVLRTQAMGVVLRDGRAAGVTAVGPDGQELTF